MRQRVERQWDFEPTPMEEVPIPPKSRDEWPPVLWELQGIIASN